MNVQTRIKIYVFILIACICLIPFRSRFQTPAIAIMQTLKGKKTVDQRVEEYGETARARLLPYFDNVNVAYPPETIILVGLKQERILEVWVSARNQPYQYLRAYPILGASGSSGPKLRQGDGQVPEGLYRIESLNPNSMFHLSLRVNYPNGFDRQKGAADGRTDLGGDIMIHGNTCSIGCLAMGDEAIEELFVLAAETGYRNVSVILSPVDFRNHESWQPNPGAPEWTDELYKTIMNALSRLQHAPDKG